MAIFNSYVKWCQGDSKTKPEPDIPIISQPQNPDATVGDLSKKFLAFAWSWLPKKNHVAVKPPNVLVNSASSGRNRLQRWSRGPNTPDLNNCEKCQENGKKKWGIGKMAGFVWDFCWVVPCYSNLLAEKRNLASQMFGAEGLSNLLQHISVGRLREGKTTDVQTEFRISPKHALNPFFNMSHKKYPYPIPLYWLDLLGW